MLATPGLTAIAEREAAWQLHVEDSLSALALVRRFDGPIVDVGSGGGAPGIPLAAALPERRVTLLEANGRKCRFLERAASEFGNVDVAQGRAEQHVLETFGVAVARALAPPATAAEWCLPLVRVGGAAILYTGAATGDLAAAAAALGAGAPEVHDVPGAPARRLVVLSKLAPTPPGFPRRPGAARKRPLS